MDELETALKDPKFEGLSRMDILYGAGPAQAGSLGLVVRLLRKQHYRRSGDRIWCLPGTSRLHGSE